MESSPENVENVEETPEHIVEEAESGTQAANDHKTSRPQPPAVEATELRTLSASDPKTSRPEPN